MNLGSTIVELRNSKGITQEKLSQKCNITQAYLSQIENNKKTPNLSVLSTICEELEIPLPILFFLSIDSEDIPDQKKAAFETLQPLIRNLISDFFMTSKPE